jgi:hypothetical protein
MAEKLRARIVIRRGTRADCKATIDIFDVGTEKRADLGLTAGPREDDVRRTVMAVRKQLESAGHAVEISDLRA